jgi:hypothetical protein
MEGKTDSFWKEQKSQFHKYHTNMFLGYFGIKFGIEDIFKPVIGNEEFI